MTEQDQVASGDTATQNLSSEPPVIALVGPPNSGKTTLFNRLTGLRQKVANYPGVTVEKHLGLVNLDDGRQVSLMDLPGVHGFSARTLDERVTRDVLEGKIEGMRSPDALILIVDVTRLEAQLMLVEPVLKMGLPTLLVLNMADELKARGGAVNEKALAERLGVDVVRTSARTGSGVGEIQTYLRGVAERGAAAVHVERELSNVAGPKALPVIDTFAARRRLVRNVARDVGFIPPRASRLTERLDSVFLHKVWGPTVFLAVVLLVFQSIFTWAVPLMDGIDWMVGTVSYTHLTLPTILRV